ncbi:MAG: hypothetical protein ABIP79_16110 [Chitinophagaceae bacterium]
MKNWLSKKITFLFLGILSTVYLFAQDDKKVDVDISLDKDGGSDWYQQPWVWIVGGAVFILLLVAMLRGSGKKE